MELRVKRERCEELVKTVEKGLDYEREDELVEGGGGNVQCARVTRQTNLYTHTHTHTQRERERERGNHKNEYKYS